MQPAWPKSAKGTCHQHEACWSTQGPFVSNGRPCGSPHEYEPNRVSWRDDHGSDQVYEFRDNAELRERVAELSSWRASGPSIPVAAARPAPCRRCRSDDNWGTLPLRVAVHWDQAEVKMDLTTRRPPAVPTDLLKSRWPLCCHPA
jgi:hypothetical protein